MIQEFDTEQLNGVPGNKVVMEDGERKKKKEKREQQENKKIDIGF